MYKHFSSLFKKILIDAENLVKDMGYSELCEIDIFYQILLNSEGVMRDLFDSYGLNQGLFNELSNVQEVFGEKKDRLGVYSGINKELKDTMLLSVQIASSFSKSFASSEDYILALLKNNTWFAKSLLYIGINPLEIEKELEMLNKGGYIDGVIDGDFSNKDDIDESLDRIIGAITDNFLDGGSENMPFDPFMVNKDQRDKKNDSKTPALDFFSTDLTAEARAGNTDMVIGRSDEIKRLLSILNRKTKNNPVLVGEPGVGKTAIVEGLAKLIVEGEVPFSMKDKKILALDMSSLVAGTKYRGEFEARIKQIIEEASKVENEVILFIDEIHTIIGAGGSEGTLDRSNILKPAMGRGKIRVIGATTNTEYTKYIEKDTRLERRFQRISVDEPKFEDAIAIIDGLKESFEEYHNLNISRDAVVSAVELSTRYITDRYLPDKAIDLIDEACSLKSMTYVGDEEQIKEIQSKIVINNKKIEDFVVSQQYKKASNLKIKVKELEEKISKLKKEFSIPKDKRLNITSSDIKEVLSMTAGVPVQDLEEDDINKLKRLPKRLSEHIIGQDEAIDAISKSIIRSKVGIGNPNRPLGSFLFLGPTGVGKTELVKVLSRVFYGSEDSLIKIDMSEYADKTGVSKLIGANAGYVGYEEGGLLTKKVREKPYSIVLFDEIEKGDFEVYNLLLQIMDEGVLTDNKGKKVNFKNTIIIMTSNLGQEEFNKEANRIGFMLDDSEKEDIDEDFEIVKSRIIGQLTDYFSPEFINRIDKTVVFRPLDKKSIKKIVKMHLDDLGGRLEKAKGIKLEYDNKLINHITKATYNPEYGAREVNRYIIDKIEDKIANHLINFKTYDIINLTIEKGEIFIK